MNEVFYRRISKIVERDSLLRRVGVGKVEGKPVPPLPSLVRNWGLLPLATLASQNLKRKTANVRSG